METLLDQFWVLRSVAQGVSYLAKMNLVKDDLVGVADANESGDEGGDGDEEEGNLVIELATRGGGVGGFGKLVKFLFNRSCGEVLFARYVPLAQAVLWGRA